MRTMRWLALLGVALLVGGCGGEPNLPITPVVTDTPIPATAGAVPSATQAPVSVSTATGAPAPTLTVPPASSATTAPGPAESSLVISSTAGEQTFTAQVGQTISVRLGHSRQWSTPIVDTSILRPLPPPATAVAGLWNYQAIAPGQTTLISEGACLPNPGGPTCQSIVLFRVTIVVTGSAATPGGLDLGTATPAAGGVPPAATWPPAADQAVANARADLAHRAGVDPGAIQVTSVTAQDWPSPALGCPDAGHTYIQVITPGYVIVLAIQGANFVYHASRTGAVATCPAGTTP